MLEKQESKWYVHCPVCGGYLIKSSASNSEVECKRCHNTIGVLVNEGCVTVYEKRDDLAVVLRPPSDILILDSAYQ